MAKNLEISLLLDFYGQMLTQKQREVAELYYNEDLSLAEIAVHSGITRQGVRDSIKRAELQLLDYEEKLGLFRRFTSIEESLGEIISLAGELKEHSGRQPYAVDYTLKLSRIIELAGGLDY